jgi:hypothetical protein
VVSSASCDEDGTIDRVLAQAVNWSMGTQQEKITATHAFSLHLSVLAPAQAVSRLWNLAFGDAIVAAWARAELIAVTQQAATDGRLARILPVIEHQLDHVRTAVPEDPTLIHRALTTTVRVLTVRTIDDTPLTAHAIVEDRNLAPLLGRLWAQVVRSWPHRVAALDELHLVRPLLDDRATSALGAAVHGELDPVEWRWLCRDLGADLPVARDAVEVVR